MKVTATAWIVHDSGVGCQLTGWQSATEVFLLRKNLLVINGFFFSGVRKGLPCCVEDGGDAPRPCAHGGYRRGFGDG